MRIVRGSVYFSLTKGPAAIRDWFRVNLLGQECPIVRRDAAFAVAVCNHAFTMTPVVWFAQ